MSQQRRIALRFKRVKVHHEGPVVFWFEKWMANEQAKSEAK